MYRLITPIKLQISLHCTLAAVQCIVIGPVCGFDCVWGYVTTITQNCVHRSSPNWAFEVKVESVSS